jgi:KDO2-lipid IV(A) lauroyltransferase
MVGRCGYFLFMCLVYLFWLLPFFVLYRVSDALYLLIYYIVRYRRSVVRTNLVYAFPDKSLTDITVIEKRFYRHLCDLMVEALKGFTLAQDKLIKRWRVVNPELLDAYAENKQQVVVVGAHYSNWEWGCVMSQQLKMPGLTFYKPLHARKMNDFVLRARSRHHVELVPSKKIMRALLRNRGRVCSFSLVADQCPRGEQRRYRSVFLNRETDFIAGPEQIAKSLEAPLVYAAIQRIKRGYYELSFRLISERVGADDPDGDVTKRAACALEQQILDDPSQWLWSHRRWPLKY